MREIIQVVRAVLLAGAAGEVTFAQTPAKWRLIAEWRVGGAVDGAHSLTDVKAIRVAPDGRVLVLEAKDQQLHILSSRGDSLKTIGRKGAGPGEFRGASGFIVAPTGEIIVHDVSNARLTVFAPDGTLSKTVAHPPWAESWMGWEARFTPEGRLQESGSIPDITPGLPVITSSTPIRRTFTADLLRTDTVRAATCPALPDAPSIETSYQKPQGDGFMSAGYPFVMMDRARTNARDNTHWIGLYPDYQKIQRVTFGTCNVVASITLRGSPMPIPAATLRELQAMADRSGAGATNPTAPRGSRVRKTLPMFESLTVDATGQLWVERLVPTTVKIDGRNATGDRRFEVFSPDGKLLAEVDAPPLVSTPRSGKPFTITADHVYAMALDANDIPYLMSYRVVRN